MAENTPYTNLKSAIEILEKKQVVSRLELQEQFKVTYEGLDPFNFLKNSFSNITGSPEVRNNLLAIILPLVTGFITKKALGASRRQTVAAQAGVLFIDGLNRFVTQNPEIINTISHFILSFFHKKKRETGEEK
ncbi:MAG: hypothetical protein HGA37_10855 [Lentimicrobium sp.]|nr:hypothetical protein [Lentimicrobium sp.]